MKWLTKTNNKLLENTGEILLGLSYACIGIVTYDIFVLNNWSLLWWYPIATFIALILGSGFYHRAIAHPTWECPQWLKFFLTFLSTGYGFAPVITWCALHREHHRHADTEKDPHGPRYSIIDNMHILRYKPNFMYVRDLMKDKLYINQLHYYWVWFVLSAGTLISLFGFDVWAMSVAVLYFHQISINIWGHMKNFPKNHLVALLYSPEIYHDEHHKNPNKSRLGLIDIPYFVMIRWFSQK